MAALIMKTCLQWKLTPSQFNALSSSDQRYMLGWTMYQDNTLNELNEIMAEKKMLSPEVLTAIVAARYRAG
jgi:hypothetical protein